MISAAIMVARIATGEVEDTTQESKAYARKGGLKGGKARAKALTATQRKEIAKKAAASRWKKSN